MSDLTYKGMDVTKAPIGECSSCGDAIQSEHRHDFKWCGCESIAVDGGSDYFKFSYKPEAKYKIIYPKSYVDQDGIQGIMEFHKEYYDKLEEP